MADLTSMLHMRGFVCAVQREDGEPQASSIAVGLDVEGDNVLKEERLLQDIGRVRDVRLSPDGYIYISVEKEGIFRLVPEGEQ